MPLHPVLETEEGTAHPVVYTFLYLPFGISAGYVTVTLAYLLAHAGPCGPEHRRSGGNDGPAGVPAVVEGGVGADRGCDADRATGVLAVGAVVVFGLANFVTQPSLPEPARG